MVGSPVGHLAAGILIPPTEVVVAALGDVVDARGLAQPHLPIETLGNGSRFEGSPLRRRADAASDSFHLANSPFPDDADRFEKTAGHLASLLGPHLKDAFGRFQNFDDLLSLVDRERQ